MRTGEVQQSLGEEAATVVTQAASLARRRGHAKVTPLHVASAMLSSAAGGGVLRAACVRCQSDPLQCDALEHCLSEALDRRPPGFKTHHDGDHVPVPSNAFAAAIKRAQAQQRRKTAYGGLSQRVAVKVELEQLVISILDDPSVHRVMREVGFSSSQVRANVKNGAVSSDRTRLLPYSVYMNITRAGQPWLENVHQVDVVDGDVVHGSLVCISDGTEVVTTLTNPRLPEQGGTRRRRKFTELTAENLNIMCFELETHLPRHRDIVPGISTILLRCRAGMSTKRSSSSSEAVSTQTTWLLFRGSDEAGKVEMAKELARLVFGSYADFVMVSSECSGTSSDQLTRKRRHRSWGDGDGLVGARLMDAILENPHRVIMISGVSWLDDESEICVRNAIAEGTMRGHNGNVVRLEDAIVVLSSHLFTSSPPVKSRRPFSLDLNARAEECEEEKDDSSDDNVGFQAAMDGVFLFD